VNIPAKGKGELEEGNGCRTRMAEGVVHDLVASPS